MIQFLTKNFVKEIHRIHPKNATKGKFEYVCILFSHHLSCVHLSNSKRKRLMNEPRKTNHLNDSLDFLSLYIPFCIELSI